MSSMSSSRSVLADTTASVVNQPAADASSDSALRVPPSPSAAADTSPSKSKRRGWDKSRLSLPIWLPNTDSENAPAAGREADGAKPTAAAALATLPAIDESQASQSGVEADEPRQAAARADVRRASSAQDDATSAQASDLSASASTGDRAQAAADRELSVSHAPVASTAPPATAARPAAAPASSASSGIPKPPTAYHTRSRQKSAHNATFSHSMRSRSPSPTPAAVSLPAPPAAAVTRRTASITAAAAIATTRSSHAASAASLLSQAASLINKSKAGSAATADSAAAGRSASKRALSKKEDAGHKRRKSTEVADGAEAAVKVDEADMLAKPTTAPPRQSVAGRPSMSGTSRSQRQSLSISHTSHSSPQSSPNRLRSYSRHSISSPPLRPSAASLGTQTAASPVETELHIQLTALTSTLSSAQQHSQALQCELQSKELELSRLSNSQSALQCQIFQLTVLQQEMRTESAAVTERLRSELELSSARQRRVDECEAEMGRLQLTVARLEAEAREGEEVRRRLHAYVEEMKGNVRVMVRVRPALPHESSGASDTFAYLRDRDMHMLEVSGKEERSVDGTSLQRKKQHFVFDHVFTPSASQAEVFEQVKSLATSVLDGYDVLVFAYGQTGAGKSWSMEGPTIVPSLSSAIASSSTSASAAASSASSGPRHRHTPTSFSLQSDAEYEQRGLIQRSVEQLFADLAPRQAKGWSFHVQLSVVQLYNDAIHDLLVERDTDKHEIRQVTRRVVSGESDWQQVGEVRDDKVDVVVSNVHTAVVGCPLDVYPLLDRARLARASGATESNAHSSRSHLIVRLHVQASNAALQQRSDASLHLIDLAGSERVKVSKAEGSRLKETAAINRSLSALADVIQALSAGDKHVPYRNSRLTHMLQPYFSGSASKSLMLLNLSPLDEHVGESLCSLRFAQTVSGCVGKRK